MKIPQFAFFEILIILLLPYICTAQELFPMGISSEEDIAYQQIPLKSVLTRSCYDNLPTNYSLKPNAPYPKRQEYGTCTTWAVAYTARTILEALKNRWTDRSLITQNVFSPGFLYKYTELNRANCYGSHPSMAIKNLYEIGVLKLADFPTECAASPVTSVQINSAAQYRIQGYTRLWETVDNGNTTNRNVNTIKKSLAEANPVVIAMICPKSFHGSGIRGDLWIPQESPDETITTEHGRHAMCVIGYDDTKDGGAFEIQNSWGTGWGNDGYIWVRYADFQRFVYQAYELIHFNNPTPPSPKPQPIALELSGSLKLVKDNGTELQTKLTALIRDFDVVPAKGSTYEATEPQPSGTRFRIYLNNNEPAFVYLLGTGSASKRVKTLFPFSGYSAALTYKRNQVAFPNEDYYIQSDNLLGTDYLIVLYSKNELDINSIRSQLEANQNLSVAEKVKMVLGNALMFSNKINFSTNNIDFKAASVDGKQTIVPIIIQFKHI
jgi:hypothetical protein